MSNDEKVKDNDRRDVLSRRNFLHSIGGMGAGIAGAGIAGSGLLRAQEEGKKEEKEKKEEQKKQERPPEDSFKTNIDAARNVPRTKSSMPGLYPGRVCEVSHPKAFKGSTVNATVVSSMLAAAMRSLTGEKDARAAWAQFFSPKDRVGIKINPIGGKLLSNNHELIEAIIANLKSLGVPKQNIVIWDRREVQMAEVGYTSQRYPGITCIGTEYMVKEGDKEIWKGDDRLDKNIFYEFDINGEYDEETMPYMINGGYRSYFTKIITEMVDKVINVPVLKNAGPCVTLCLKNLAFGVTSNTARGHQIWNRYNAEVCAFPSVRDKVVLNIIDGLKGCYDGGPGAVAHFIWNANTIWAATDPVAADRIGWEKVFEKRAGEGIAKKEDWEIALSKYDKLTRAEKLGLGFFARERIDLRKTILS